MISEQLKVDLRNYELFADGFNSGPSIQWFERASWTENKPMPLTEEWLRGQLRLMEAGFKKYNLRWTPCFGQLSNVNKL